MSQTNETEPLVAPERVYRALRQAIFEGTVAPGDRLTTQRIAEQLGVSRTPVRAALVRLESEGLIERTGGQSARVRALTTDEVSHAYDVAMAVEGMLVYRLAQADADAELDELVAVVERMSAAAAVGDKTAWVQADERFHALLIELGGNPLASATMERVESVIGRLRFLSLHLNPHGAAESAEDHRAVVEAVRRREADAARSTHHTHWERVRAANLDFLRDSFATRAGFLLGPQRAPDLTGSGARST